MYKMYFNNNSNTLKSPVLSVFIRLLNGAQSMVSTIVVIRLLQNNVLLLVFIFDLHIISLHF